MKVRELEAGSTKIPVTQMKVGDVGKYSAGGRTWYVLRGYKEIVRLCARDFGFWEAGANVHIMVEILPPGTKLELEID